MIFNDILYWVSLTTMYLNQKSKICLVQLLIVLNFCCN